jgi:hypothetical protein
MRSTQCLRSRVSDALLTVDGRAWMSGECRSTPPFGLLRMPHEMAADTAAEATASGG